jgi:hypothetical protein
LIAAAATSAIDAYERLRAAVLSAEPVPGADLGTVRRRGLAAWLRGLILQPSAEPARARLEPARNTIADPAPAATELTRVIAGIVIALVAEPAHA